MPKQWWSSRSMLLAQSACLLLLVGWSVHHAPGESGKSAAPEASLLRAGAAGSAADGVIDNSDGTASIDEASSTASRFVVPPPVHFRTENPASGTLNLRPVETTPSRTEPWQPVHPQNPPSRAPSGPRLPFEVSGNGATVYNPPPAEHN